MERNLYDMSAELDGVAALVLALSAPYLEGEGLLTPVKMGEALCGIENYIERINTDLLNYADGQKEAAT